MNAASPRGDALLMLACYHGHTDLVGFLPVVEGRQIPTSRTAGVNRRSPAWRSKDRRDRRSARFSRCERRRGRTDGPHATHDRRRSIARTWSPGCSRARRRRMCATEGPAGNRHRSRHGADAPRRRFLLPPDPTGASAQLNPHRVRVASCRCMTPYTASDRPAADFAGCASLIALAFRRRSDGIRRRCCPPASGW